jgi:hypothetical protein
MTLPLFHSSEASASPVADTTWGRFAQCGLHRYPSFCVELVMRDLFQLSKRIENLFWNQVREFYIQ